jgi:aspartate carbamoyltransferase catalytic subunit
MSLYRRSLLDVENLSLDSVFHLFDSASRFLSGQFDENDPLRSRQFVIAQLFFEPSTRTRMSFEMAAARLGISSLRLDDATTSSLSKGETYKDTLLNIIAMSPQAVLLRYGEDDELTSYLPKSPVPILIAGYATRSHPTQALLDAFTIQRQRGHLQGERVLIVGDVAHSRVAYSNIVLLKKMGAEVAVCGPRHLIQLSSEIAQGVKQFANLDEGLRWASVCMALRIQLERMDQGTMSAIDHGRYRHEFGLTVTRLKGFSAEGMVLHPGPINQNVELDTEVLDDPRCQVLAQVGNGVAIRAAILGECLGLKGFK